MILTIYGKPCTFTPHTDVTRVENFLGVVFPSEKNIVGYLLKRDNSNELVRTSQGASTASTK